MASQQPLDIFAPLATPVAAPPEGEVLTESQWATLMAIGDAVVPSIDGYGADASKSIILEDTEYLKVVKELEVGRGSNVDRQLIRSYLAERASQVPGLKDILQRTLALYIRPEAKKGIMVVLSALDTRAGCLLATGSTTSFHMQPVAVRQQIIQNWTRSYLPAFRTIAKSLTGLFKIFWTKQSPTLRPLLGVPRAPIHGKPGKGFDYDFIQFALHSEPETIETDVVIVGSGCGAGVCAKNVAEAGHRVIVVDKAYHFSPEYLPMTEADAGIHLYTNGGFEATDDNSLTLLAGQAWGGGGTINWSASLQTQAFVRKEWADGGLPFFTSSEFQDSLDRICHRMGVSADHIEHNFTNRVLLDGSRKLGYSVKSVPQNTGGVKHYDGYCTLGCGSAEKQGPMVSFLPDAAKAGALFIEGFDCDKVIFEEKQGKRVAVGVKGTWKSRDGNGGVSGSDRYNREVIIKAKRVIVSGGTLNSPLILIRSGLKNPQIGRNLHLHPVSLVVGIFPQKINPWEGGILTAVCDEFQNLDGHGHGTKLEAMTMMPSSVLPLFPWTSGLDFKRFAAKHDRMTGFISLSRDRDTGRVYPDPVDGQTRIAYTPSAFDRKHILEGILALAKITYIMGAEEISTTTAGVSTFIRQTPTAPATEEVIDHGINDPHFQSWLAEIQRKGLNLPEALFGSAHQMGTCRMGTSEKNSVVNEKGQVWATEGLYVADASVFPSASGVNPMVTNMGISDWISRGLARELKVDGRVGARL